MEISSSEHRDKSFSPDIRNQKLLELGEAEFYASSSQKPQPLHLFLFASDLQSFLEVLEFDSYQDASSAIQLVVQEGQLGWVEGCFHDF